MADAGLEQAPEQFSMASHSTGGRVALAVRGEEVEQLAAREPATEHRPTSSIRSVRVENMLGDIQPDRGNL